MHLYDAIEMLSVQKMIEENVFFTKALKSCQEAV